MAKTNRSEQVSDLLVLFEEIRFQHEESVAAFRDRVAPLVKAREQVIVRPNPRYL